MNAGEIVAATISKLGIDTVFGLVGNQISPILVHFKKYGVEFIGTRHEQAAVHMADGWAQEKRACGIALVSGGPGFTNTINGIMKAYKAETPLVLITGASVYTQKDKGYLQDMDQLSIVRNICKWAVSVYDANRIEEYLYKAVETALSGKMGPVVLELPINTLRQECSVNNTIKNVDFSKADYAVSNLKWCTDILNNAKKPIVLLGDEVYYNKLEEMATELIHKMKIPVLTINKARGLISDEDEYCFGNGRVLENGPQMKSLREADVILVLGVRWDYQMDCFTEPSFHHVQKIIYVSANLQPCVHRENLIKFECSVAAFMKGLLLEYDNNNFVEKKEWNNILIEYHKNYWKELNAKYADNNSKAVSPMLLLNHIKRYVDKNTILVLDGSNAMFWAALIFDAVETGQIIIAPDGQHGTMGTGLPLALGAKKAFPNKKVILYTGDGSIGFNIAEMDTSVRYNLPVTIFVHNDGKWGLCETTQEILYNDKCGTEIQEVSYANVAKAFGGYGYDIKSNEDIERYITEKSIINDKLTCFDVEVDNSSFSPGLVSFNETLRKMK